jgi:hypothetical protein
MELDPVHAVVVVALLIAVAVPWLAYKHGKKVGDQTGYIRGYKEGQQSGHHAFDGGTFPQK